MPEFGSGQILVTQMGQAVPYTALGADSGPRPLDSADERIESAAVAIKLGLGQTGTKQRIAEALDQYARRGWINRAYFKDRS